MCDCQIPIGDLKSISAGTTGIPLQGVMNNDMKALIVWAWCINQNKVKQAFKDAINEDITESSLPDIIKVHNDGNDVKQYKINFYHLVRSIKFTPDEINKASCNYKLTT